VIVRNPEPRVNGATMKAIGATRVFIGQPRAIGTRKARITATPVRSAIFSRKGSIRRGNQSDESPLAAAPAAAMSVVSIAFRTAARSRSSATRPSNAELQPVRLASASRSVSRASSARERLSENGTNGRESVTATATSSSDA
jgi:hypothetical protein